MDNNDEMIKFLQKVIGYSITGDTREGAFFILYGKGARFVTSLKVMMEKD